MPLRIGAHGVFADAEVQGAPVRVALPVPVCRSSGRTRVRRPWWCCCFRRGRPSRPTARAATGASALSTSPDALRVAMPLAGGEDGQRVGPAAGQPCGPEPVQQRGAVGVGGAPGVVALVPCGAGPRGRGRRPGGSVRARRRRREGSARGRSPGASLVAATSSSPSAEPWALPVFCLVGGRPADDGAQHDERGAVGLRRGARSSGRAERVDVLDVASGRRPVDGLHVPAVGGVAGERRPR